MRISDEIAFKENVSIPADSLLKLYTDAGWAAYTRNPKNLNSAISNSLYVLTAWKGDKLIALIRVVGDGISIIYIQDILVLQDFRRQKIGTQLLRRVLAKYAFVRQKVLLTDDTQQSRKFYESLGFTACDNGIVVAFAMLGK